MDPQEIQKLVEEGIRRHYRVKIGDTVRIELPRVPLFGATQYLKIDHTFEDPNGTLEIRGFADSGEGVLGPGAVLAEARRPGQSRVLVSVVNRLTGSHIEGTSPIFVDIEVEE